MVYGIQMYSATSKYNATKKSGGSRRDARYGNRTEGVLRGRYHGDITKSSKHPRSEVHRICRETKDLKRAMSSNSNDTTKLLVSNLDLEVSDLDMQELFEDFGVLKMAAINCDRTGRPNGTADVVFERRADALRAINELHGRKLDGRALDILFVKENKYEELLHIRNSQLDRRNMKRDCENKEGRGSRSCTNGRGEANGERRPAMYSAKSGGSRRDARYGNDRTKSLLRGRYHGDIAKSWKQPRSEVHRICREKKNVKNAMSYNSNAPTILRVSNLDLEVSDLDMRELFEDFGILKRAGINRDRTGRPNGTADVVFERRADALRAMNELHGRKLDGRALNIQVETYKDNKHEEVLNMKRRYGEDLNRYESRGGNHGRAEAADGGKRSALTAEQLDAELDAFMAFIKEAKRGKLQMYSAKSSGSRKDARYGHGRTESVLRGKYHGDIAKSWKQPRSEVHRICREKKNLKNAMSYNSNAPTILRVSNLDLEVSDLDMQELFEDFGVLKRAAINRDRAGRPNGTADVVFERRADALRAMKELHGRKLDGRALNIQVESYEDSKHEEVHNMKRRYGEDLNRFESRSGSHGRAEAADGGKRSALTAEQLDAELDAFMAFIKEAKRGKLHNVGRPQLPISIGGTACFMNLGVPRNTCDRPTVYGKLLADHMCTDNFLTMASPLHPTYFFPKSTSQSYFMEYLMYSAKSSGSRKDARYGNGRTESVLRGRYHGDITKSWKQPRSEAHRICREKKNLKNAMSSNLNAPTILRVSNLDLEVSDLDMQEIFEDFGILKRAGINRDRTGRPNGTADVVFERRADALRAMNELHGRKLDGRVLDIQLETYDVNKHEEVYNMKRRYGEDLKRCESRSGNHGRAEAADGGNRSALTAEQLDAELDAFMAYIKEAKRGKLKEEIDEKRV
ncbi:hypothetical protein HW555_001007 [Spodoptera exigua]|uniref:RRM domain-containing protein n=1 Tax=Spodoptera exigua TaxID=7107 RepID=A0A835GQQ8_SPOEX|nr:hypothetical protein HW555_001007 [Spodoptera exigua]